MLAWWKYAIVCVQQNINVCWHSLIGFIQIPWTCHNNSSIHGIKVAANQYIYSTVPRIYTPKACKLLKHVAIFAEFQILSMVKLITSRDSQGSDSQKKVILSIEDDAFVNFGLVDLYSTKRTW